MRTILTALFVIGTFLYGMIFRYPPLWFMNSRKRYKYTRKIAKTWGKQVFFVTGSKMEVIYVNDEVKNNIENLQDESLIIISNHASNLDIPVLLKGFPKYFAFVAKKEMEKWPLIGKWMKSLHCIFLDRTNVREGIKDMKKAIELINEGNSYVIFPEGGRTEDGNIKEFKKGSFKLATSTNSNIVPVTLIGTYEIQKKGKAKITPNKNVKMIIDNPINTSNLSKDEINNIHNIVRDIIVNNFNKYKTL